MAKGDHDDYKTIFVLSSQEQLPDKGMDQNIKRKRQRRRRRGLKTILEVREKEEEEEEEE